MTRRAAAKTPVQETSDDVVFISFKTTKAFHAWLTGLADRLDQPLTQTLDLGLRALARNEGYPEPPRRLYRRRRGRPEARA